MANTELGKIRKINLWLISFCIVLLSCLLIVFLLNPYQANEIQKPTAVFAIESGEIRGPRPFDYYEKSLKSKLVFQPPRYEDAMITSRGSKMGSLQLLGITGSEDNRRALIKDGETESCALYSVGQFIGDLKIETITDNSVVFGHGENKVELKR